MNILFYVADANEPAVIWINGKSYPFSYGYGYSPMESEAPLISICDINNYTEPSVSYTHLTLPTKFFECRSSWSTYN